MNTDALKIALESIRRKNRFEAEIASMLAEKGYESAAIINYLRGRKFIDDQKMVASEVERLTRTRNLGPARVREELLQRGAPERLLDAALAPILENQTQSAVDVLYKRFSGRPDKGKAMRFLLSKGYDEETAESAYGTAFGE